MNSVLVDTDYMNNIFKFNQEMLSNFPNNTTFEEFNQNLEIDQNESKSCLEAPELINMDALSLVQNESKCTNNINNSEVPDFPDDCLKFISDILLEEILDENLTSAQEFSALQATEKSLYDALGESYPYPYPYPYAPPNECLSLSLNHNPESPYDTSSPNSCGSCESNLSLNQPQLDPIVNEDDFVHSLLELHPQCSDSSIEDAKDGVVRKIDVSIKPSPASDKEEKLVKGSRRKKIRQRDDDDGKSDGRGNKIQAATSEDYVEMELYDDILLCSDYRDDTSMSPNECTVNETRVKSPKKGSNRSKKAREKKQNIKVNEVDLRTLLIQCAQAVSTFDLRTSNELLKKIRQHSSPYGDSVQRLGHHFANGLEARLAGTGSTISTNLSDMKISSSDFLKSYKLYVSSIPFKRMSFFLTNNTILKLTQEATKIHIIDFGVFLGLQWPCLIQSLSKRPKGPPKLRITGIDFPQQGFRPAERINATGRRLAGYCSRFGVPFEYQGIANKWENIQPQDLKLENDEMIIVNCIFRSGTLLDETVDTNSPRDAFLGLIRNLNPRLFIHGIVNGTFTAPFFTNRFKEALHHYSSIFEVFDANLPREAHERLLIESEIYGKELINVVACEGIERIQRPETYKQWQVRTLRAGLRQIPLQQEFLKKTKAMVKANYHQEFLVDEDRDWMLQGWKGRIFCALSFWEPTD